MKSVKKIKRVKIPIKNKGSLSSLGYSLKKSPGTRERALRRAVNKYGYSTTMKRVNALYVFNKNKPSVAKKLKKDKLYLSKYVRKNESTFGMYKSRVVTMKSRHTSKRKSTRKSRSRKTKRKSRSKSRKSKRKSRSRKSKRKSKRKSRSKSKRKSRSRKSKRKRKSKSKRKRKSKRKSRKRK